MDLQNVQVLITGGSDGIGKALAKRLLNAGCQVMVTGRDPHKLAQTAAELPGLLTFQNDISQAVEREALAVHIKKTFINLDILVNNAGIQRRIPLAKDQASWPERQAELDILLAAPVHLNHLILSEQRPDLIVNVTSGGAYIPQAFAPLYSACKAALHHYTLILRDALSQTHCRVAELIPPAVQTGLSDHGADLNSFADQIFQQLFIDDEETVGFGPTAKLNLQINGTPQSELFIQNTERSPVVRYNNNSLRGSIS